MIRLSSLSAFLLFLWIGPGWPEPPRPRSLNCLSGATFDQRQKCDEEALGQAQKSQTTQLDGGWRLVRTRNPSGGADAVSVMHVADTAKSDTGLAGLSLQCGRDGVEVVLVVLERLSLTARPSVTLTAGINRVEFEASVVQGGEVLLLPQAASNLAVGAWQSATELSVEIEAKPAPIRGAVPIGGLSAALNYLSRNCPAR